MPVLSRRRLLGAAAGVVALAAGATAGWLSVSDQHRTIPPEVQRHADVLQAALDRELALLDQLAASVAATPILAPRITVLRADHGAHRDAIAALIRSAGVIPRLSAPASPGVSGSAGSSGASTASPRVLPPPVLLRTVADLVQAERANQGEAGATSANLSGTSAAVLASISACEATHVAWLG